RLTVAGLLQHAVVGGESNMFRAGIIDRRGAVNRLLGVAVQLTVDEPRQKAEGMHCHASFFWHQHAPTCAGAVGGRAIALRLPNTTTRVRSSRRLRTIPPAFPT